MSLSEAAPRREIHTRTLELKAFEREDGLFDLEGQVLDTKPFDTAMRDQPRPAGTPIHDLWLRLTVNGSFEVVKAEAAMPQPAYPDCVGAVPNFSALEGLTIGTGWNKRIRERVGGVRGCTHLIEMMAQLATVAVQSLWSQVFDAEEDGPNATTSQLDACYGYRSDGDVIRRYFPAQYTGDLAADLAQDKGRPDAAD